LLIVLVDAGRLPYRYQNKALQTDALEHGTAVAIIITTTPETHTTALGCPPRIGLLPWKTLKP
jgi:hypothetical protein